MSGIRYIIVLALTVAGGSLAQAQFYNLGVNITPYGVSGDGSRITGYAPTQYFLWTPAGGLTGIGGTPPGNGVGGTPRISNDGSRVAGTDLNPASGKNEMSYYTVATGTWTHLGGIGGMSGPEISSGWGISGNGHSIVGLGWVNAGSAHAIQWQEGGSVMDLGSTVPGRSTRANAVNQDGSVVAGWQDATTGFRQGAVWVNGVQTLITQGGNPLSEASAVSATGQWVVGAGSFANDDQAWRWSAAGGVESLGTIFDPSWRGFATAISGDGDRIVGFYRDFGSPIGEGFLWTPSGGMVNLTDYVHSLGIDTGGVTLVDPLAISADGNTIVGIGLSASGLVGFVVRLPASTPVPEPTSVAGLAAGVVALFFWRWRRKTPYPRRFAT
jgi:uncharacterized membrane protein